MSNVHGPHVAVPAWLRHTQGERRWPVTLSVVAAIVLQFLLPAQFTQPLPPWLMPTLEIALLIGLSIADPVRIERRGPAVRVASIVLIALITAANVISAILLIRAILDGQIPTWRRPTGSRGSPTTSICRLRTPPRSARPM